MADYNEMRVNKTSLRPMLDEAETQIIMQRHCNYDKNSGLLKDSSISEQQEVIAEFVEEIKKEYGDNPKIFFLFSASNTIGAGEVKRCVETTDIAMKYVASVLGEDYVLNYREGSKYGNSVHEDRAIVEPKMFTDGKGYYEFLLNEYGEENIPFWTAFEEDKYKEKREELDAEGPDEIVDRADKYVNALQLYAEWFHAQYPGYKLIIWTGTHYDLISPLVKRIRGWDKTDVVWVDYCGGISLNIDKEKNIVANVNDINYSFDLQYTQQPRRRF